MRVNLITQSLGSFQSNAGTIPLSLTIKPACGLPGEYQFPTDSASLLKLLNTQTDLPATVIQRFAGSLTVAKSAKLLGVELSERTLTNIGYFVD